MTAKKVYLYDCNSILRAIAWYREALNRYSQDLRAIRIHNMRHPEDLKLEPEIPSISDALFTAPYTELQDMAAHLEDGQFATAKRILGTITHVIEEYDRRKNEGMVSKGHVNTVGDMDLSVLPPKFVANVLNKLLEYDVTLAPGCDTWNDLKQDAGGYIKRLVEDAAPHTLANMNERLKSISKDDKGVDGEDLAMLTIYDRLHIAGFDPVFVTGDQMCAEAASWILDDSYVICYRPDAETGIFRESVMHRGRVYANEKAYEAVVNARDPRAIKLSNTSTTAVTHNQHINR